jgi:hypothetical protein
MRRVADALLVLTGCMPVATPDDKTFEDIRALCRKESREAFYSDAGEDAAIAAYHHCLARWGVL